MEYKVTLHHQTHNSFEKKNRGLSILIWVNNNFDPSIIDNSCDSQLTTYNELLISLLVNLTN